MSHPRLLDPSTAADDLHLSALPSPSDHHGPVPRGHQHQHRISSRAFGADGGNLNSNFPPPWSQSQPQSQSQSPPQCPQPQRSQLPFYYPPPTTCFYPPAASLSTPAKSAYTSPPSTAPTRQSHIPYPHHSRPRSPSSPVSPALMNTSQDFVAIPSSPPPTHTACSSSTSSARPYPSPTASPLTLAPTAADPFRHAKHVLIAQVQRLPLPYYHHELIIKGENAGLPNVLYFDVRHTYFPNLPPSRSILVQWDNPNAPPIVLAQVYARAFPVDPAESTVDQIASVLCRVPCAGILAELHPDMQRYLPAGVGWAHSGCEMVYYPTSRVYRDTMRHVKCQWLIDPRRKVLKCDKCTCMLTRMNRERERVEGKPCEDEKYKRYHPSLLPYLKQHYSAAE